MRLHIQGKCPSPTPFPPPPPPMFHVTSLPPRREWREHGGLRLHHISTVEHHACCSNNNSFRPHTLRSDSTPPPPPPLPFIAATTNHLTPCSSTFPHTLTCRSTLRWVPRFRERRRRRKKKNILHTPSPEGQQSVGASIGFQGTGRCCSPSMWWSWLN